MSSLVTYASPWNDDGSGNKKRQPTMRKQPKLRPTIQNMQNVEQQEEYMTFSENFQGLSPSSIDDAQANATDRAERVNELLNKITSADTAKDGKMGDFAPIDPPSLNVKKDMPDNSLSNQYIPPVPTFPHFNQQPSGHSSNAKYSANAAGLDNYSHYGKSYEGTPYYAKLGLGPVGHTGSLSKDDKLMEKINYMIHLLEQQQNEKTDNVTEEFILYTFLGVFIIFIVDSFARTGKYTR
jgi:hypothetical protein